MGVASLILGIIAIILSFAGIGVQWIGAIVGLIGVILGAMGRKNPEKAGVSTAGLVCSILGLILSLITYLACVACVGGLASLV